MPELAEQPTKKSFVKLMAESRPKNAQELQQANANPPAKPAEKPASPPVAVQPKEPSVHAMAASATETPAKEEAKPAVAVAAADPDEEILSGKRSPKGEDFKRVKHAASEAAKQRDEFKGKLSEYEKELGELKKQPKHNAELIKALETERNELKSRWDSVSAQFDPTFNQKFDERISSVLADLKPALPKENADKITALLTMPDSEFKREKLKEFADDLDPITAGEITQAMTTIRGITRERQAALAKAGEAMKSISEERGKQLQERQEALSKAFDAELSRRQAKDSPEALPVFQLKEGDSPEVKEWNAGVLERSRVAKAIFDGKFESPQEAAEAAIWAASAPGFLAQNKALAARVQELEAALSKVTSGAPTVGSAGSPTPEAPKRGGFMEKLRANSPM